MLKETGRESVVRHQQEQQGPEAVVRDPSCTECLLQHVGTEAKMLWKDWKRQDPEMDAP